MPRCDKCAAMKKPMKKPTRKPRKKPMKGSGLRLAGSGAIQQEITKQVVKEVLPFLVKESVGGIRELFKKKKTRKRRK